MARPPGTAHAGGILRLAFVPKCKQGIKHCSGLAQSIQPDNRAACQVHVLPKRMRRENDLTIGDHRLHNAEDWGVRCMEEKQI